MSTTATAARTGTGWQQRTALAWTVAALVKAGPVIAGLAASLLVAVLLPAPVGTSAVVLWWTAVVVTPLAVVVAAERALRRLAPLSFLLRLSVRFPGQAPSRLKVVRETYRTSQLLDQLRDVDPDEVEAPPTAASTLALITALERHDRFTRGHAERVRLYTDLLGEELGLAEVDRQRLRWAALLHDIGKLRVDGEVLNKDGRPDDDEWEQLQRHPALGLRLAGPLAPWLGDWAGAIVDHHERFDGTGYPAGKAGDDISLAGRIVAVADAYETMTAGRPYKQALDRHQARDELVACAGTQFDPRIVRAFLNLSLPRTPWPALLVAWLAQLPLLARLKAAPNSAVHGAAVAAGVAAMAVTGLVSPSPSPPTHEPAVAAQPDRAQPDRPRPDTSEGTGTPTDDVEVMAGRETSPTGPDNTAGTDQPTSDSDDGPDGSRTRSDRDEPEGLDQHGDGSAPDPEDGDQQPAPRQAGHDDSTVLTALYLRSVGSPARRHDVLPLSGTAPDRDRVGNYDTDIDDRPGLLLRPTDRGRSEARLDRRQRWALTRQPVAVLAGPLQLDIWVRPATTGSHTVALSAFIDVCTTDLGDCRPITEGHSTDTATSDVWQHQTIGFDPAGDVTLDSRLLILTVTAGAASTNDLLVAFDTAEHQAALTAARVNVPLTATAVSATSRGGPSTDTRSPR